MPKKSAKPRQKNPAAAALGKLRAKSLTAARRKEIASLAAKTRWAAQEDPPRRPRGKKQA